MKGRFQRVFEDFAAGVVRKCTAGCSEADNRAIYEILESEFMKMENGRGPTFAAEAPSLGPSTPEVKAFDYGKAIA